MVLSLIAIGFLLATVLVGVFFASIYSLKRQLYLLFWAGAWLLFALHLLPTAISHWTAPNPFLLAMSSCLFGFAGISFFLGTQLYMRQKVRRGLAFAAAVVLAVWAAANALQVLSISAMLPASLDLHCLSRFFSGARAAITKLSRIVIGGRFRRLGNS